MTETPLDAAWMATEAPGAGDAESARFWEVFAGAELHLAINPASLEGDAAPQPLLFPLEAGETALVFDTEDRLAGFMEDGKLVGAFFAAPEPVEVARSHVLRVMMKGDGIDDLLAGRPGGERADPGATVCSCFDVGVNTILTAIADQGLADVDAIGKALQAGTNCGSCRPELQTLLTRAALQVAAE